MGRRIHVSPALWLFVFVLLARVVLLVDYGGSPFFGERSWDAEVYHDWAARIADGDLLGDTVFHHAPLYPYFLACLIRLFGLRYLPIYMVQTLLSAASAVLLYGIGRQVHSRRVGVIAGILFAVYGMFAFYTLKLLATTLAVFLHLLLVWLLLRRPRKWTLVAAGTALGLLILCRPYAMLYIPFAAAYVLARHGRFSGLRLGAASLSRRPREHLEGRGCAEPFLKSRSKKLRSASGPMRRGLQHAGLFLAPVVFLVALTAIRNTVVGGDVVLVSSNGGENFYVGNHAEADGTFVHVTGMGSVRSQGRDTLAEAKRRTGRSLTPSGASAYWFRQGMHFIVGNPGKHALLLLRKLRYAVSGAERSNMYYLWFERRYFTPSLGLFFVNFYLLLPFAAVGWVEGIRCWRAYVLPYAVIVLSLLNILIFFHDVRFRLPAIPFVALFAAIGLSAIYDTWRRGGRRSLRRRPMVVLLVASALSTALFLTDDREPDHVKSHLYAAVGDAHYDREQFDAADAAYARAHECNPTFPLPVFAMIKVAFARGRKEAAVRMYQTYFPKLGPHYEKVVLDDPDFDDLRTYIREMTQ